MNILGIETSCDETAAAVVKDGTKILSNVIASSSEMHTKTGGIIPEQAARAQIQSIIPVVNKAMADGLRSAGYSKRKRTADRRQSVISQLDAIAVTVGPGLIGSLLVGVETAKTLSYLWEKPIIPVNHLVAHIYANFIGKKSKVKSQRSKVIRFPAVALIVSGGHTDLVLMNGHPSASSGQARNIKWIGGTRDDAAGEAFDKCARLLGLPYPGGPSIATEADKFRQPKTDNRKLSLFPRPMINSNDFDFSFSGLKTSVLNRLTDQPINRSTIPKYAAEVQEAIVDSLVTKSVRAIQKYKPKSFLLSGGVAANNRLREKLMKAIKKQKGLEFHVPPPVFCTDNAGMIAASAFYNYHPASWKDIVAIPQLAITGEA